MNALCCVVGACDSCATQCEWWTPTSAHDFQPEPFVTTPREAIVVYVYDHRPPAQRECVTDSIISPLLMAADYSSVSNLPRDSLIAMGRRCDRLGNRRGNICKNPSAALCLRGL